MTDISIRSANLDDAQAIADFHVKVWRQTYRDLAPVESYAVLDEAYRGKRWTKTLSSPEPGQLVLVARNGSRIVGIGAAGHPSHPIFAGRGEIKFLYIDPDFRRRGVGRALLSRLATHLKQMQFPGAALSVVKGNDAALAFYTALKGRLVGEFIDPGPVWRSDNLVLVWDDLQSLNFP